MNRQKKQLCAAAILLLAALGVLLAVRFMLPDEPAESEPEAEITLLGGIPQPFVRSVTVINESGSYTIASGFESLAQQESAPDAALYSLEGMDTAQLNQTALKALMTTAANLPAKRVVAEDAAAVNLEDYGLAPPSAVVEITCDDHSDRLEIGGSAPGSEGTYVLHEGGVYLVESVTVSGFLNTRLDFVSKIITPGNSISSAFASVRLAGRIYPQEILLNNEQNTGRITEPVQAETDQIGLQALWGVFGVTASAVVAESDGFRNDTAAAYGLDDPWMYIEVERILEDEDQTTEVFALCLGEPDSDGYLYGQSSMRPDYIYLIHSSALSFLDLSLFDLRDKYVILPEIDLLSAVEVLAEGDMIYLFELSGEGDALTVQFGGDTLDSENFRRFYKTLISARYEEEISTEDNAQDTAADAAAKAEPTPDVNNPTLQGLDQLLAESGLSSDTSFDEQESQSAPAPQEGAEVEDVYAGILLQITYRYRDGREADVVTFHGGPARKALVGLNGGQAHYTRSAYVQRVLEDLGKVAQNEEVTAYQ